MCFLVLARRKSSISYSNPAFRSKIYSYSILITIAIMAQIIAILLVKDTYHHIIIDADSFEAKRVYSGSVPYRMTGEKKRSSLYV